MRTSTEADRPIDVVEFPTVGSTGDSNGAKRLIRPAEGVSIDGSPLRLQDVSDLAKALAEHSEGKLAALRTAAEEIEQRMRERAAESRARIDRALEMSRDLIERRLKESEEHAQELAETTRREAYESGEREGRAAGDERGYEEGLARGLEEGRRQGREEAEKAVHEEFRARFESELKNSTSLVNQLVGELDRRTEGLLAEAQRDLPEFAREFAKRVTRCEVELPEAVLALLSDAVERIVDRERLTIEVHPADVAIVEERAPGIVKRLDGSSTVEIVANEELGRGACRVSNRETSVDLSVESQIEILERRLRDERGSE